MSEPALTPFRVMTWNIHAGVGSDGVCDLYRVADFVRLHHPDVAALQEVDSRKTPGENPAFAFLSDALGGHTAHAKLITAPDGECGHAVFSRWPISSARNHDISMPGREPRAAIECVVETPFGPLHMVAAHLGLSLRERHRQADLLSSLARSGPDRTLILGDFNDWIWPGSVQHALAETMAGRTHHKTFPARLPVLALDRIYWRPSGLVARTWTDPRARVASDHLPVIGELALRL
jgi:endonuclease/exonuclease/phosphatase family metal-dependent hydrolase